MKKRVALLHTTPVTLQPLADLSKKFLQDVEVINLLDDSLLRDVIRHGGPDAHVNARIAAYMGAAESAGCCALMSACSSIGESIEALAITTGMLICRIDTAMAEQAVSSGTRIGIAATVETTLRPTANLVARKAEAIGKTVAIRTLLMSDAYSALISGDSQAHDRILLSGLSELVAASDVVVLAQASMARVLPLLGETSVPVLTSPESGMSYFGELLRKN